MSERLNREVADFDWADCSNAFTQGGYMHMRVIEECFASSSHFRFRDAAPKEKTGIPCRLRER